MNMIICKQKNCIKTTTDEDGLCSRHRAIIKARALRKSPYREMGISNFGADIIGTVNKPNDKVSHAIVINERINR